MPAAEAPTQADVPRARATREPDSALAGRLAEARRRVSALETAPLRATEPDPVVSPDLGRIRWFALPSDAADRLSARAS